MDRKITDVHLAKIAKFLPKWKVVARLLGLEVQIVKDIEDLYRDGEDQRYEAMRKWVRKKGPQATYRKLYDVLQEIDEEEAAEKVKELAREHTTGCSWDDEIKDIDFIKIARNVEDWQDVFKKLGLGRQVIKDIEIIHRDNVDQCKAALRKWTQNEGSEATYRALCTALKSLGHKGAMLDIEKIVGSRFPGPLQTPDMHSLPQAYVSGNAADIFKHFLRMLRERVNPDDISAHLLASHLISNYEKAEIDNPMFTPQVRMDKLLAAVQRAININAQNFETFLDVIGKEGRYPDLADEMRGNTQNGITQ